MRRTHNLLSRGVLVRVRPGAPFVAWNREAARSLILAGGQETIMSEPKPSPPEDLEILDTGQEEVFSRTEVELGNIEHATEAGKKVHVPDERQGGSGQA